MSDELVTWLREQVEADKKTAEMISSGGFAPERWDTDPLGQVSPERMAGADAINALLRDPEEEDRAFWPNGFWVALYSWGRESGEPESERTRGSELPVLIVNDGRRESDHCARHDPRTVVARCEAELAILDEHWHAANGWGRPINRCRTCTKEVSYPCRTIRLIGSGYRFRPGYREEWKP